MQKKGSHINAVVATSQIGHVLQARCKDRRARDVLRFSQPFALRPANLTIAEQTSRWMRTVESTDAGEEDERREDAMDISSTRNSSRLSYDAEF